MTRYAKRTDRNQAALVRDLRQLGMAVTVTHHIGHGIPDLIVTWRGVSRWVEVKGPRGKLTPAERDMFPRIPGPPVIIARCAEDVVEAWQ